MRSLSLPPPRWRGTRPPARSGATSSLAQDLDAVAVGDDMITPDALAVEPRRRSPDAGAGEARRQIVMDGVGDGLHADGRLEREGLLGGLAVDPEMNPDQARQ